MCIAIVLTNRKRGRHNINIYLFLFFSPLKRKYCLDSLVNILLWEMIAISWLVHDLIRASTWPIVGNSWRKGRTEMVKQRKTKSRCQKRRQEKNTEERFWPLDFIHSTTFINKKGAMFRRQYRYFIPIVCGQVAIFEHFLK